MFVSRDVMKWWWRREKLHGVVSLSCLSIMSSKETRIKWSRDQYIASCLCVLVLYILWPWHHGLQMSMTWEMSVRDVTVMQGKGWPVSPVDLILRWSHVMKWKQSYLTSWLMFLSLTCCLNWLEMYRSMDINIRWSLVERYYSCYSCLLFFIFSLERNVWKCFETKEETICSLVLSGRNETEILLFFE